jgi:hypothetical protein
MVWHYDPTRGYATRHVYDLRDPRRGFFSCDWRVFIFLRFGLVMANVPLP